MTTPAGMSQTYQLNHYEYVVVDGSGRERVRERVVVQVGSYEDTRIGSEILDAEDGGEPTGWRLVAAAHDPAEDYPDVVAAGPPGTPRHENVTSPDAPRQVPVEPPADGEPVGVEQPDDGSDSSKSGPADPDVDQGEDDTSGKGE